MLLAKEQVLLLAVRVKLQENFDVILVKLYLHTYVCDKIQLRSNVSTKNLEKVFSRFRKTCFD